MEKRAKERFIKRCEAVCTSEGVIIRGVTSNLSEDGLFVRTNQPFKETSEVIIELHLPTRKISKLKGIVMRAFRDNLGSKVGMATKYKNGMGIMLNYIDNNYVNYVRDKYDDSNNRE